VARAVCGCLFHPPPRLGHPWVRAPRPQEPRDGSAAPGRQPESGCFTSVFFLGGRASGRAGAARLAGAAAIFRQPGDGPQHDRPRPFVVVRGSAAMGSITGPRSLAALLIGVASRRSAILIFSQADLGARVSLVMGGGAGDPGPHGLPRPGPESLGARGPHRRGRPPAAAAGRPAPVKILSGGRRGRSLVAAPGAWSADYAPGCC